MKRVTLSIMVFFAISGCSAPTQKVAQQAEQIRNKQNSTVVTDLANIGKQGAVNARVAEAIAAVKASDPKAAQAAVEGLANDFDQISGLQIEYTKARFGPGGIVDQYIWQQQGVFDIMFREYEEAKAKVAKK